jgi:hypothetical protein
MQTGSVRRAGSGARAPAIFLWIAAFCFPSTAFAAAAPEKQAPAEPEAAKIEDALVTYSPPLSPADRAVFVALRRDIDLTVEGMPLRTFAAMLAKRIGVKVTVETGHGIDPATRLDIECRKRPLESALRQVLAPPGLDYRVSQGRLILGRQDNRQLATRTYSVADLCPTPKAFDALLKEVRSLSHESVWEDMGGWAKLAPAGREFILVHLPSEQEHVLRLLTEKRREAKERPKEP